MNRLIDDAVNDFIRCCDSTLGRGVTWLLLHDTNREQLVAVAYSGARYRAFGYARIPLRLPSHYTTATKTKAIVVTDTGTCDLPCPREWLKETPTGELYIGPAIKEDEIEGLLVFAAHENALTSEQHTALEQLTHLAGSIIALSRRQIIKQDNTAHFRDLYAASRDPVAVIDLNFEIYEANPALAHLLNSEPALLAHRNLLDFFPRRADALRSQGKLQQARRSGVAFFETTLCAEGRDSIEVAIHATMVVIQGQPMLKAFIHDITPRARALDELKRLNRHVILILESATDAYISCDTNWTLTYFNGRAEELFSVRREYVLGHNLWEALPSLTQSYFRPFLEAQQTSIAQTVESYLPSHNRWMEAYVNPHSEGLSIYIRDTTETTETERSLRENQLYLQTILSSIADGIITVDKTGIIHTFNDAAERLFNCRGGEVCGKLVWTLLALPYRQLLEHSFLQDQLPLGQRREVVAVAKNGPTFPAELTITPMPSTQQPMYVINVRDVTEQKRQEFEIQSLAKFTQENPNPVLRVDTHGILLYANPSANNLVAHWSGAIGQRVPPDIFAMCRDALHTNASVTKQIEFDTRMIDIRFTPFQDVGYVNLYGNDVTERVQAEEQLRQHRAHLEDLIDARTRDLEVARDHAQQANRTKSAFLAHMSHELRTPLNAIIGYTELLSEDATERTDSQAVSDLHRIDNAAKHLLAVINDILDLSKIEAGKIALQRTTFDVEEVIESVVQTIRPMASWNSNQFTVSVQPDVGSINSDATRLRQCLFNLLSNACKFTEKGTITLDVRRFKDSAGEWLEFCVADTGIGMAPEQIEKLFEAFAQLDNKSAAKFAGTGLGLSISQHLARMMGGDIFVASQRGQGSRFTMLLPIAADSNEPIADVASEADAIA